MQRKLQILRRLCVLRREKNGCERKVAYGRFYRLHVLWLRSIYIIGATIYQIWLWIKKARDRKKFKENEDEQKRTEG